MVELVFTENEYNLLAYLILGYLFENNSFPENIHVPLWTQENNSKNVCYKMIV